MHQALGRGNPSLTLSLFWPLVTGLSWNDMMPYRVPRVKGWLWLSCPQYPLHTGDFLLHFLENLFQSCPFFSSMTEGHACTAITGQQALAQNLAHSMTWSPLPWQGPSVHGPQCRGAQKASTVAYRHETQRAVFTSSFITSWLCWALPWTRPLMGPTALGRFQTPVSRDPCKHQMNLTL